MREGLDPDEVGNFLHVLRTKNKLTTFEVRGTVKCTYYGCFNKVPPYFWLSFKLKREKEIAVESMLINQDILVLLPTAYWKSS